MVDVLRLFGKRDDIDVRISRRNELIELIAEDRRKSKAEKGKKEWSGSALDYYCLVGEYPQAAENARERAWRVLFEEPGYGLITHEADPRRARMLGLSPDGAMRTWNAFSEFIYMYEAIDGIAKFCETAKRGGEVAYEIPFLVGGPGTGKSQFVRKMFKLMVGQTMYVIRDCPMHETAIRLIPMHLRLAMQEKLGRYFDCEGDLCRVCQWNLEHKWKKWEEVPITTMRLSVRRRIGLITVYPVDPNNQDVRVLIGSESIPKLLEFEEGDPRLGNYQGAFPQGEGGIIEFPELTTNPNDFLHVLVGQTMERLVAAPGFYGNISSDALVIGHSNFEPYEAFCAAAKNVATKARFEPFFVPYVLSYQDLAEELYPKMLSRAERTSVHMPAMSLESAARFEVASSIEEDPTNRVPLSLKIEMLNGTEVKSDLGVNYLRHVSPTDGRDGVSPRFTIKAIEAVISDLAIGYGNNDAHPCVSPEAVIKELRRRVVFQYEGARLKDKREKLLNALDNYLLVELKKWAVAQTDKLLRDERASPFLAVALDKELETLAFRYRDVVAKLLAHVHWIAAGEGEEPQKPTPKELEFANAVERLMSIPESSVPVFRQEMLSYWQDAEARGERFLWHKDEEFRRALLEMFVATDEAVLKIAQRLEQDEKLRKALAEAFTPGDFCPTCVVRLFSYVATRFWQT